MRRPLHRYALLSLLLASTALHAQDKETPDSLLLHLRSWYDINNKGPMYSTADSLAFIRFKEAAAVDDAQEKAPHPLEDYRLVWVEAREGHNYRILHGDGRSLAEFVKVPPPNSYGPPLAPWFHGTRYATFGDSPPTGLIRFEYWYFERPER